MQNDTFHVLQFYEFKIEELIFFIKRGNLIKKAFFDEKLFLNFIDSNKELFESFKLDKLNKANFEYYIQILEKCVFGLKQMVIVLDDIALKTDKVSSITELDKLILILNSSDNISIFNELLKLVKSSKKMFSLVLKKNILICLISTAVLVGCGSRSSSSDLELDTGSNKDTVEIVDNLSSQNQDLNDLNSFFDNLSRDDINKFRDLLSNKYSLINQTDILRTVKKFYENSKDKKFSVGAYKYTGRNYVDVLFFDWMYVNLLNSGDKDLLLKYFRAPLELELKVYEVSFISLVEVFFLGYKDDINKEYNIDNIANMDSQNYEFFKVFIDTYFDKTIVLSLDLAKLYDEYVSFYLFLINKNSLGHIFSKEQGIYLKDAFFKSSHSSEILDVVFKDDKLLSSIRGYFLKEKISYDKNYLLNSNKFFNALGILALHYKSAYDNLYGSNLRPDYEEFILNADNLKLLLIDPNWIKTPDFDITVKELKTLVLFYINERGLQVTEQNSLRAISQIYKQRELIKYNPLFRGVNNFWLYNSEMYKILDGKYFPSTIKGYDSINKDPDVRFYTNYSLNKVSYQSPKSSTFILPLSNKDDGTGLGLPTEAEIISSISKFETFVETSKGEPLTLVFRGHGKDTDFLLYESAYPENKKYLVSVDDIANILNKRSDSGFSLGNVILVNVFCESYDFTKNLFSKLKANLKSYPIILGSAEIGQNSFTNFKSLNRTYFLDFLGLVEGGPDLINFDFLFKNHYKVEIGEVKSTSSPVLIMYGDDRKLIKLF